MNDNSRSAPSNESTLKQGQALTFSAANFEGQYYPVTADMPNFDLTFPPASIQLGPNTGVTIFSDCDYQGTAQNLSANLPSFSDSRLQAQSPKSLKFWLRPPAGKDYDFQGYWAIEVSDGQYLSVQPGGVLATSPKVTESEEFQIKKIADAGPNRNKVALSVRSAKKLEETVTQSSQGLSMADLENLTLVDEPDKPETGCRKFSLHSGDNQWFQYDQDGDQFLKTVDHNARAIFNRAIKIAENESQVGEVPQGEAALYENPSYWGRAWVFREDYANFESILGLNDTVSSIQLGPLTAVTVYKETQFTASDPMAGKQDVIENIPSLAGEQVGQDTISSLKLWKIVSPVEKGVSCKCSLSQDFRGTGASFQEYSAYRTNLRLDPTVKTVTVWATDEATIEVDSQPCVVNEDTKSETFKPNLLQCLVITTDVIQASGSQNADSSAQPRASLKSPALKIRTNTMQPNERIVIYPDQALHASLANLKGDDLWNATIKDKHGKPQLLIDQQKQNKADIGNAQSMISKVMSTVKYNSIAPGVWSQTVSPTDDLRHNAWRLDFQSYSVTADNVRLRKEPLINDLNTITLLRKDEIVRFLNFSPDNNWIRIIRVRDGQIGWASVKYLDQIVVVPPLPTETQYRVDKDKTGGEPLNLREGPGTQYSIIKSILPNSIVNVLGANSDSTWKEIRSPDGVVGWASADYLTLVPHAPGQPLPPVSSPIPTPLPAASALVLHKVVNFNRIDPEEVQALRARAVSLDAQLQQGLFDDFVDWVKKAESVVVAQANNVVQIFVTIGKEIVTWVANTAQMVVACVEGVFEQIGLAIESVIKWLRFVFDWDDILQTRDYLCDSVITALDFIGHKLAKSAKEPVSKFFKESKHVITDSFDAAITALGGSVSEDSSTNSASSIMSSIQSSGIYQVLETGDWFLSKIMSGGQEGMSFAFASIDMGNPEDPVEKDFQEKLGSFWAQTLGDGLDIVTAIPEAVVDIINSLVNNPDKPLLAVAALLKMFRKIAVDALDLGENIVLELINLAACLVEKIKNILTANIRIPIISDILEWMGKPALTLGFSILQAATLILAVPVTAISKIILNEAPFKHDSPLKLSVTGWSITAGVSDVLGGIISMPLDAAPDEALGPAGPFMEAISFIFTLTSASGSWIPDIADWCAGVSSPTPSRGFLLGIESLLLAIDAGSLAAPFVRPLVPEKFKKLVPNKIARFKRLPGVGMVGATVLGIFHAGAMIADDKFQGDCDAIVPDVWTAAPEILSFLKLPKFQEGPGVVVMGIVFSIVDVSAGFCSLKMNTSDN